MLTHVPGCLNESWGRRGHGAAKPASGDSSALFKRIGSRHAMNPGPLVLCVGLLACSLAGCASEATGQATRDNGSPATEKAPKTEKIMDAGLRGLVAIAVHDLARRLGKVESDIVVIEARAVIWPDRSLGCPQPGVEYLQVQQDGALIRLQADGRQYAYHSGGHRSPFLCEPRQ